MKKRAGAVRPVLGLAALVGLVLFCSAPAMAAFTTADQIAGSGDLLFYWLTGDVARTIFLIVGIAGVVVEILTVGSFGVFGACGIAGFLAFFWSCYEAGDLNALVLWLILGGVILLVLEIFVIPGFGVAGALGIIAILVALVLAGGDPQSALISLVVALAVSSVIIWFTLKNKRTRKLWSKLVLGQRSDRAGGYDSVDVTLNRFLGQQGVAVSILRPAGTADFSGEKLDVVTRGEFIEAGRPVEVILVEGMRVVVKEVGPVNAEK